VPKVLGFLGVYDRYFRRNTIAISLRILTVTLLDRTRDLGGDCADLLSVSWSQGWQQSFVLSYIYRNRNKNQLAFLDTYRYLIPMQADTGRTHGRYNS
jgi:hypothetical protein